MNKEEKFHLTDSACRLCLVMVCAMLYMAGGSEELGGEKWLRRYLAPAVECIGLMILTKNWLYVIQAPLRMITLSLGYGADEFIYKVQRRFLWGLANGISASTVFMFQNRTNIIVPHILFMIAGSILIGVWNPFPSPRHEELVIGILTFLLPIMGAKKG